MMERSNTKKLMFGQGHIDRNSLRRQLTTKLFNDDSLLPLITTPEANNILVETILSFHGSTSSPALFTDEKGPIRLDLLDHKHRQTTSQSKNTTSIALLGLLLFIVISVTVFVALTEKFRGHQTVKLVDALYFTVVTLCTIGYGDIVPATTSSKLFTCIIILVGFGIIDILLDGLVRYVLNVQEGVLLGVVDDERFKEMVNTYIVDKKKGRMRIRTKMCFAMGAVILCLAIGTVTAHFIEHLTWIDSFYLSVTSVTTVGYGDHAFKTLAGRCFAIVWLLASTLTVARAFLYITEYRMEKRNRKLAKEVLHKKLTVGDLVAADMDHDGAVSKTEFVIFKLKEMGKITDEDVTDICKEFDSTHNPMHDKITISDLLEGNQDKDIICLSN